VTGLSSLTLPFGFGAEMLDDVVVEHDGYAYAWY
jgi:hypothetical protein